MGRSKAWIRKHWWSIFGKIWNSYQIHWPFPALLLIIGFFLPQMINGLVSFYRALKSSGISWVARGTELITQGREPAILFSLMIARQTWRKTSLIPSTYQPAYKPHMAMWDFPPRDVRDVGQQLAQGWNLLAFGIEVKCGTTRFLKSPAWQLQVSVKSKEVDLGKHSHPVIRLGLNKELSASTKGGRYSAVLKDRCSITALTCWSCSFLPSQPPRSSHSFLCFHLSELSTEGLAWN